MHVTIVGASRFGVATASRLIEEGHDVVLIDVDRDRIEELSDTLDCGMICGDGTLPSTLRDAFGDGSDALIALTNEDDVNILASVVGRSIGFKRVIPQIVRSELISVVEELDLDEPVTPHESLAHSIVSGLTQHSDMETDLSLDRELRLVRHKVPDTLSGKTIDELELGEDVRPIAVSSEDGESFPEPDFELQEGQHLLFVIRREESDNLIALFEPDEK